MSRLSAIALPAILLFSFPAFAEKSSDMAEARAATERWMKLMDSEEYSAAWNSSAERVRKDMPKFAWTMLVSATRLPLGGFRSREFKAATVKTPAADKSESVVLEYAAAYEKSKDVQETVTVIHEADGIWRVSGYGIATKNGK